jgi:glycosyltransferase involved in cell wall biosynthesis
MLGAAVVRFKLGKLVMFVQDLPTEAAHSVGMLKQGPVLRAGRSLEHLAYKLADHIVVISSAFAKYIESVGVNPAKISEIPNWADIESIRPERPNQDMRRRLGAGPGDFLVVHTGNMGAKQDLLNVISAAVLLKEDRHIKFALVGDGQERQRIADEVTAQGLENVKLLPLQPAADFSNLLASSDALLVNQAPMVVNSVLPSKLLTYMASGRPVLAAVHRDSTTAWLVRQANCGLVAAPGQPDVLAAHIREMAVGNGQGITLDELGQHGRAHVEGYFGRESLLSRWDDLLADIAPGFRSR